MSTNTVPPDGDELDGCELDFAAEAEDEETVQMLPLFPDKVADPERARFWRVVALWEAERGGA